MEQNQGIKAWQWVVTVIVIIIVIVLGYYMFKGDGATVDTDNVSTTTDSTITTSSTNRVNVADQYPGNVVYVTSVQFENAGWVSIHKDNAGKPGVVIGSTYFEAGTNPGKVNLSESTVNDGTYYAMLHSDDGDKKFDETKDIPLKDNSGNIIMKVFRATTNITEIKG
ncbi:MAG TPA: hypothetical protein VJC02_01220 [Candidatus Paceibacterota bacterium]